MEAEKAVWKMEGKVWKWAKLERVLKKWQRVLRVQLLGTCTHKKKSNVFVYLLSRVMEEVSLRESVMLKNNNIKSGFHYDLYSYQ